MKVNSSTYYLHTLGHSVEEYSTGYIHRFWFDSAPLYNKPNGAWMYEKIMYPISSASEYDVTF